LKKKIKKKKNEKLFYFILVSFIFLYLLTYCVFGSMSKKIDFDRIEFDRIDFG